MLYRTSLNLLCFYRLIIDKYDDIEDIDNFMDVNQWTDLAKIICDGIDDGLPARSHLGKGT